MSDFKYFPIIKTRDAELRCFKNLEENTLKQILPIYELTKSRRTKVAPDGDIHRRMLQIKDIQQDKPYILDLSTNPKYINPQIEQLIDEYNGFVEWQYFLNLYKDQNIIPMVHLYEDDEMTFTEVEKFVREMSLITPHLAVRMPHDLEPEELASYLRPIVNNLQNDCTLFVLLDACYVRDLAKNSFAELINDFSVSTKVSLDFGNKIEDVVMLCTSFPSSTVKEAQGQRADFDGIFRSYEEEIFQKIKHNQPAIKYGDYASINTEQIEMKGGTFVPRIDIALDDGFIYKRYRRDDGSYPRCAKEIKLDPRYIKNMSTWANTEIELASKDTPTGISPSYWISVRMEYYINTRLKLRSLD